MSRALDTKWGRQGGRIVPWQAPASDDTPGRCDVCGGPMLAGQRGRHAGCTAPIDGALALDLDASVLCAGARTTARLPKNSPNEGVPLEIGPFDDVGHAE